MYYNVVTAVCQLLTNEYVMLCYAHKQTNKHVKLIFYKPHSLSVASKVSQAGRETDRQTETIIYVDIVHLEIIILTLNLMPNSNIILNLHRQISQTEKPEN